MSNETLWATSRRSVCAERAHARAPLRVALATLGVRPPANPSHPEAPALVPRTPRTDCFLGERTGLRVARLRAHRAGPLSRRPPGCCLPAAGSPYLPRVLSDEALHALLCLPLIKTVVPSSREHAVLRRTP
jgi:hypothetical protein